MDREEKGIAVIQLRIKTEYNFGQSFAAIPRVIERLKAIGCTAACIMDTNSTWGHVRWFDACTEAGIQPILGVELIVSEEDGKIPKMGFIAKNTAGLSELYRLASKSHRQTISTQRGSFPRLFYQDVVDSSDNILKMAGEIIDTELLTKVGAIIDLSPASRVLNAKKSAIAAEHKLRVVSVSDNAFCFPEDKEVYELISKGGLKPSPQYILDQLDHQDTAAQIAAECLGLQLPKTLMIRAKGNLEQLCRDGIVSRGMKDSWTEEYETRLKYELELIKSKDFESYFIIVADLIVYAKKNMLVGPGRGSSAGSLVCYLTHITEIDPIPPGLFFERFIDVSRNDLPDIDTDFPDDKRYMVFDYAAEKYGKANTAHIGTISDFKPKSALIQVCKALGIPPQATAAVKVAMIERGIADSRSQNCLEDTLTTTDAGKAFIAAYPQAKIAAAIEGHASHTGVHAAGLLICNEEITNYATVDVNGIAHIEKGSAEKLGLLKIDVLGLRTLGVLADSQVDVDWYGLKFDDPATYDIFNQRRLYSIFQFEGQALQSISTQMDFTTINDIAAITALAMPGPFGAVIVQ